MLFSSFVTNNNMTLAPRLLRMVFHRVHGHNYDVGAIVNASVRNRLFCLTDKDLTHELVITTTEPEVKPAIGLTLNVILGVAFYDKVNLHKTRYHRMKHTDVNDHLEEIKQKQAKLDRVQERINRAFLPEDKN